MANQYIDKKRAKIEDFFKIEREHVRGKFYVAGYDPMN